MRRFLYISLVVLGLGSIVACASHREVNAEKEEFTNIFPNISPEDSLFASIQKTPCFGKCPIYTMKIYNSGYTTLHGKGHLQLIGDYSTRLTKEDLLPIIAKAKEIGYMEMKNEYDNPYVTDIPSTITSLVIDGKRKQVIKRVDFPKVILELESLLNDFVTTKDWRKVEK